HTSISGLEKALIQYVNTGFECPARENLNKQYPSFVVIDTNNYQADVFYVTNQNNSYQIVASSAEEASIGISPFQDFSSYIVVDNTQGNSNLQLVNFDKEDGYYIVNPPNIIRAGEKGRFWMQDYSKLMGGGGTQGQVTYKKEQDGSQIDLTYACPNSFWSNNECSGANFYTSNDGVKWSNLNEVINSGIGRNHPFFVRFVI
ncbi:MAG: hypothetical protein F6K62_22105, partial [Sphaerospermopsis sp. SIO1G2]|nr:hypothetical protein [Sphaerospermopsis sp. SIO1G2]